jgi:hypothetical protein
MAPREKREVTVPESQVTAAPAVLPDLPEQEAMHRAGKLLRDEF